MERFGGEKNMAKNNEKLTPELSAKFCEAIAKGHSIEGACGYVGIAFQTYRNWIIRGEKAKGGKYKQFLCDVEKAHDEATRMVEQVIIDSIPMNTQDAKWWLTKRRPELYAERTFNETKVEADVKTELLTRLERPLPELEKEED